MKKGHYIYRWNFTVFWLLFLYTLQIIKTAPNKNTMCLNDEKCSDGQKMDFRYVTKPSFHIQKSTTLFTNFVTHSCRAFLEAWCRLRDKKKFFLCILRFSCDDRIKFWTLSKFEKIYGPSSGIFIPEKWKRTFDFTIQIGPIKSFEITSFETLPKPSVKISCFSPFSFVPEKPHVNPKNIVCGMGWTWVAGSPWDFSEAQHHSHIS